MSSTEHKLRVALSKASYAIGLAEGALLVIAELDIKGIRMEGIRETLRDIRLAGDAIVEATKTMTYPLSRDEILFLAQEYRIPPSKVMWAHLEAYDAGQSAIEAQPGLDREREEEEWSCSHNGEE